MGLVTPEKLKELRAEGRALRRELWPRIRKRWRIPVKSLDVFPRGDDNRITNQEEPVTVSASYSRSLRPIARLPWISDKGWTVVPGSARVRKIDSVSDANGTFEVVAQVERGGVSDLNYRQVLPGTFPSRAEAEHHLHLAYAE